MIIPVILSGGAGSRLWPVSREAQPKPFIPLADGQSLLQKTLDRARQMPGVSKCITVTNRDYYFQTKDEFAKLRGPMLDHTFLLEPFGRNTAPAIALAALAARQMDHGDAVLLVLPADHLIADVPAFTADAAAAATLARTGKLVTFGIKPTHAETGFGYIEMGADIAGTGGKAVTRFVEKPYLELAQKYLAAGNFTWNSGMFAFTADAFLAALEAAQPAMYDACQKCWEASLTKNNSIHGAVEVDADTFKDVTDLSVDYAVMEKSPSVAVVPAKFDWSDIGSWSAMQKLAQPDEHGNAMVGDAVMVDTRNTYVQSDGRLVATVGVDNLIVVDTPDALLVANADRSQDVKKVVDKLKGMQHESAKVHRTVSRPWGTYTVLEEGPGFKVKRIEVKPGSSLSLQMHHHRSEHWIVVQGTGKVTNGERVFLLQVNESTYIPAGQVHRLENPGKIDLAMIEVQAGSYLGEDDIVRFQDNYGRIPTETKPG
jgi:mannose-1-phosphate guanylyltransferase / mannose-6-phosphate isomerase